MNSLADALPITIDELPQYSPWIHYLLGLKSMSRSLEKNAESVGREYGQEKWGVLLQNLRLLDTPPTITHADRLTGEEKKVPFYAEGKIFVYESSEVQNLYFQMIRRELQAPVEQSGHLVELGSGYGSIILKLASLPGYDTARYTAGELTDTGVACMNLLASHLGNRFEAGSCDLDDLNLEKFTIPENAVFFTCWAAAYIKGFSRNTLFEIIRHKPMIVIHIEPIYEHWSEDSLLQLLWRRYLQMNDYNQSLLTSLKKFEAEGLIQIIEERNSIFGSNSLAPVSIIKWIPVYNTPQGGISDL